MNEKWAIEWHNPEALWAPHGWKRMNSIPPQALTEAMETLSDMVTHAALNHLQFRVVNVETGESIPADIL